MYRKIATALAVLVLWTAAGCREDKTDVGADGTAPDLDPITASIVIQDTTPYHVHEPGVPFTVSVKLDYSGKTIISYQWRDYRGSALMNAVPLPAGQTVSIRSPGSAIGYYGLVFSASDARIALPNREPGEEREYGFAILPARSTTQRPLDGSSAFGMVHADMQDPNLSGWIKTATWQTYGAAQWKSEMDKRRKLGMLELPLVVGGEWEGDDTQPVSAARLAALETRLQQYFAADPGVCCWELGLEENLQENYRRSNYWANLEAKVGAARHAADAVDPAIKLIYQVAEMDRQPIRTFLASDAARDFDILALHPYPWPDFPTPETWLTGFLDETRAVMAANHRSDMPIWFTEVGAPHHGNAPGRFFGYPESGKQVKGLSRADAAAYLVKLHVLALHAGVEKLFWYNYQDRGAARDFAEDHFGIRDYWGYPKPVYPAYVNVHSRLTGKQPSIARLLAGDVWVRAFRGADQDVYVLWTYPAASRDVPWSSLDTSLALADIMQVTDAVGAPLAFGGVAVRATGEPIFVIARRVAPPAP